MEPLPSEVDAIVDVNIRRLTAADLHLAVKLLALGMRDNPLHVQVFGVDVQQRHLGLQRLLGGLVAYVQSNGILLGAYTAGELVGVLGMIEPGRCQPSWIATLRFTAAILTQHPPTRAWRIGRWLNIWAHNDAVSPHWHLGPMTVLPSWRRHGIARKLMAHGCRHIDSFPAVAALETDLAINVAFYETLGFVVTRQQTVLGVSNWFLTRPAKNATEMERPRGDRHCA